MDKGVALVEATGTMVHVEMKDKSKALSSLHTVTIAKLSLPSSVVVPVGTVDKKLFQLPATRPPKRNAQLAARCVTRHSLQ